MLGSDEPRNYLVLVQNNAEVRATGGLSGVLALIRIDEGSVELVSESTGSAFGRTNPPLSVDKEQTDIFSTRLGAFIGDVNLTPDFPTAASTAKGMWERRYGGHIDGVVAMDPIVLAHLLKASGPIPVSGVSPAATGRGLPTTLSSENVVPTLLNEVYKRLETNESQDAYYAAASHSVFDALSSGKVNGPALLKSLSSGYEENRLHVWSSHKEEQDILMDIPLGGSISGPSQGGASFGVYFNDGTGAKMDFYMRRKVQLTKTCTSDGYAEFNVRVELSNTAPADAASALPAAITGGGRFGVPAGSVQTNVVVYGPAQAHVDTATQNGTKIGLGSYMHRGRPVGIVSARLAAGETTTLDMTFLKVVQDTEPTLAVTPTIQDVKDVTGLLQTQQCP
ncbi:DUF4012 domain-containing protein [Pseudarthrobacter defluvii]|nr:DUF4012 domain-containing protein [Pseudarthrobacter defluvii]